MADVIKCWDFTLSNEDTTPPTGKIVTEPNGAMARLGINSHWHPEALGDDFYSMNLESALAYALDIFKYDYWAMILGYNCVSDLIGAKWSDLAFNASPDQATTIVQRAVNSVWTAQPLDVDGICGTWTMARINQMVGDSEEALYRAIVKQGTTFYGELQAKHPEKFSLKLEAEWIKRLNKRPFA